MSVIKGTDYPFVNRYICNMFKRLFLLSGVIALVLACLVMWFWYIPNHPDSVAPVNQPAADTVSVADTIN